MQKQRKLRNFTPEELKGYLDTIAQRAKHAAEDYDTSLRHEVNQTIAESHLNTILRVIETMMA